MYHPEKLREVYDSLSFSRRSLVTPYVLSDTDFAAQWKRKEYDVRYKPEENITGNIWGLWMTETTVKNPLRK